MMAIVASEGRLFSLKASEWFVLLASVAFCGGFLTLFFDRTHTSSPSAKRWPPAIRSKAMAC